jgi:hypothetical protein
VVIGVGERIEALANTSQLSPIDRLLALGKTMQEVGRDPYEFDLVELFHRPENRAVHDRISEHIITRLTPSLTTIIADGIAARLFDHQDPRLAPYRSSGQSECGSLIGFGAASTGPSPRSAQSDYAGARVMLLPPGWRPCRGRLPS